MNLTNVLRTAAALPWAIVPEKLEAICAVLEVRANAGHLSPEAIKAAVADRRRANLSLGGAVAVIPMSGVIAPRMNVMTEMSGGCSAEQLTEQIRSAVENPQVSAIVLDVDSPGGQVAGIPELAAKIRGWRDQKPIIAVANHLMASAAYWLASAASEVVAAPSAEVGSIGVFTIHTDVSRADAAAGIQRTLIKAGLFKGEDLPFFGLSDAAKQHLQAKVDEYMTMFAGDVAQNRRTTTAKVMAGYGQGQLLLADSALAAGLVDRIATLEEVIDELSGSTTSSASVRTRPVAASSASSAAAPTVRADVDDDDDAAPDCPDDGTSMQLEGDEYVCPTCGYRMPVAEATDDGVAKAAASAAPAVDVVRLDGAVKSDLAVAAVVEPAIEAAAAVAPRLTVAASVTPTVSASARPAVPPAPRRGGASPTQPVPAIRVTARAAKEHNVSDELNTSAQNGADERSDAEVREISTLAASHAVGEHLSKWIEQGTRLEGPDGVRAQIGAVLRDRLAKGPQTRTHAVALTDKEERQFSYARAIQSAADGSNCFERDVSQELEKHLPKEYHAQGGQHSLFVPTSIRTPMDGQKFQATGLDSATSTKGTELKFVQYGGFIDLLRNKARVLQAGARMLSGLTGPVTFVKQNGAGTFSWVSENGGADVSDSNLLLTTVTLSAKTGQSTTSFSRQLLRQAVEDIESIVRNDLAAIHAIGVDAAALYGSGSSGQPTGVFNTSGVGVVALGTNGAAPTYPNVINQIVQIGQANADEDLGAGAFITTPGMKGTLQTTTKLSNNIAEAIWSDDDTVAGKKGYSTNQVQSNLSKGTGSNLHAIYYGIWQQLLIGEWGAMELVVDPYRLKKQGMIEVTSFEMIDIAVRYAGAFSLIKDAISSF